MHQRAADRCALLHAARKLPGKLVFETRESHHLDQLAGVRQAGLVRELAHLDLEHDVLQHRAPGKQHVTLEHDADAGRRSVNALAGDLDRAARGGQQASYHLEECALAATAGSDHRDELAVPDVEVQRFQRFDLALFGAIGLGHPATADQWRCMVEDGMAHGGSFSIKAGTAASPSPRACPWSPGRGRHTARAGPWLRGAAVAWRSPWCDRARWSA